MKPSHPSTPTRNTETAAAVIFVSIIPRLPLHKVVAGDSTGLLAHVRRLMTKVERDTSGPVKVLSCYDPT